MTNDTLTGRGGLSLFVRNLRTIQICSHIDIFFGFMRRRRKGQPIPPEITQLLCFFFDGTDRHRATFNTLSMDAG